MKVSDIEDKGENEVSVPKIAKGNQIIGIGKLNIVGSKLGGKVKKSEVELERKRSNERFKELQLNGTKLFLLNSKGEIVETSSKMCGDDEYMFTALDGTLRVWKGGISVFDDGANDILFHRPHLAVNFNESNYPVISDVHNFEMIPIMRILNAIGVIDKIFGKDE